jgi:hypothetical protein
MNVQLVRFSLAGLGLVLAACEVPRPGGAFNPRDAYSAANHGFGETEAGTDDDPGVAIPDPPVAVTMTGRSDASVVTTPPVTTPPDPTNPVSLLQGRYLMRVDLYSTASASSAGSTLTLNNRISNMLVATLTLQSDGTLASHEVLCNQTYQSECISSCTNWVTAVDHDLPKKCVGSVVDRAYAVDAHGKLQAAAAVLPIGFVEDPNVSALPTDHTDPRVWVFGDPSENRFGVNTHLTATLGKPPLLTEKLDCVVSSVQRFSTVFSGQLDMAKFGKDALVQKPMSVDSSATTGKTIYVDGVPTMYCNKNSLNMTSESSDALTTVRFQHYEGANCPGTAQAYDALFPPIPMRPDPKSFM